MNNTLKAIIDDLCNNTTPHFARDFYGREVFRDYLMNVAVDYTDDHNIILTKHGDVHTHMCQCDACSNRKITTPQPQKKKGKSHANRT